MGRHIRAARALSGFLSVLALLALVVGEFYLERQIRPERVVMLLGLIAALLGVDLVRDHLPLNVTIVSGGDESDRFDTQDEDS